MPIPADDKDDFQEWKKKKRGLSTSFRSLLVYIGSINLFDEILSMVMLEVHGNFGKFYLNLVNEILAVLN